MVMIQNINKKIKMMTKKETQIKEDYTIMLIVQKKKKRIYGNKQYTQNFNKK